MIAAGAMLALVGKLALAAAPGHDTPATEPPVAVIPVPGPAEEPPPPEVLQWNLIGDVQGDVALATSAPKERVRTAELRRARLALVADAFFDWRLRVSGDFGKYRGLRDLSLEYRGWPLYLSAGRMVEPFGLLQGGASGAAFMERPQPLALGPGYGVGFQGNYAGETWALSLGTFDATQNDLELGGRSEKATTGRLTSALFRSDTAVLHAGVSASRRRSGEGFLQFDALPETTLLDGYDAQSAILYNDAQGPGSNKYWIAGGEAAWEIGSLTLESEYLQIAFDQVNTFNPNTQRIERISPPRYNGYYVEAAWLLTGEQRDYSVRHGMFGNVFPAGPLGSGGFGAVELAARYSKTDLHYDIPFHGPTGDIAEAGSVGINWYPGDTTKVMLEGLQIKRTSSGSVGANDGDPANPSRTDWIVQARVQWYFVLP